MEEPPSTTQNSNVWKLWHGLNYFIGGSTFLLGSLILFPFFETYFDTASLSAWLYTIGSFCFLLADLTEWSHFERRLTCSTKQWFLYKNLSINFLMSVLGSFLYLVGSIFFIPILNQVANGERLFIAGSVVIAVAQGWKVFRIMFQNRRPCLLNISRDPTGFCVDVFAGVGAIEYFVGTLFMQMSASAGGGYLIPAIIQYTFGGTFFFISAVSMQKRYFFDYLDQKISSANVSHITMKETTLQQ